MDTFDNPFGHLTNELASRRLQFYQGCAIIEFRHLRFEVNPVLGSREFDERNSQRLLRIFEIEGCGNTEPEHRVAALIDQETFSKALTKSNLTRESLLDPTNQLGLSFEGDVRLMCVYGKHRLKAAESFGETKWLVDLYLDTIPLDALTQLREESAKSLEYTDGEIYRMLRMYQIAGNSAQENKWRARLSSEGRREDIRRLQLNKLFLNGLDNLLPFVGMWKPLKASQIERMLALKSPELIYCYLRRIYESWLRSFERQIASCVDFSSVQLVEGLMPQSSLADRRRLAELFDSGQIFPLVTGDGERAALRDSLQSTPGRIISLNTLIKDTLFLEEPAKALRCLCPPRFKGSFKRAMLRQWKMVGTERSLEIQRSEHHFATIERNANSFSVCMMQLWLFALRHFVRQRRGSKDYWRHFGWSTQDLSLRHLAVLAERLGFQSNQIASLRSESLNQNIAKGFMESLCREDFYRLEEYRVQSMSNQLRDILHDLPTCSEEVKVVQFTTNSQEAAAKHRYNRPTQEQYDEQRKYLFLEQLFGQDQAAAEYPTSLGVTREILRCFFGDDIREAVSTQLQNLSEEPIRPTIAPDQGISHQNESFTVATEPISHHVETNQMPTEPMPLDQDSSQYSRSPGEPTVEGNSPSDPVDMEPYPSGTPDPPPPLAAGFEDPSCNCPLERKNYISVRRKVPEILTLWFRSQREVIVIFLFESRIYYKFNTAGGFNLRSLLQDLSREHIFIVINDFGIGTPDINKTYEEALKERLLLVGRRDNPAQGKDEIGMMSLDKLRDYVLNYDSPLGKRKAGTDDRPTKRFAGSGRESSEEL